jgi:hypothetical protein
MAIPLSFHTAGYCQLSRFIDSREAAKRRFADRSALGALPKAKLLRTTAAV